MTRKVLLLYSGALSEGDRNDRGRDTKVLNTIKFIKKNLPNAVDDPVEICDPSTDATGDMDVFDAADYHLENCGVYVLILSNRSTNYFQHLKKAALWNKIQGTNCLIIVSVEQKLNADITRHLRTACCLHLIGYEERSPIDMDDSDWVKFCKTVEKCIVDQSIEAQNSEEAVSHYASQPDAPMPCADPPPAYDAVYGSSDQMYPHGDSSTDYGMSPLDNAGARVGEEVADRDDSSNNEKSQPQALAGADEQVAQRSVAPSSSSGMPQESPLTSKSLGAQQRNCESDVLVQGRSSSSSPPAPVSSDAAPIASSAVGNDEVDAARNSLEPRGDRPLFNNVDSHDIGGDTIEGSGNTLNKTINYIIQSGNSRTYLCVAAVSFIAGCYLYKNKSAIQGFAGRYLSSAVRSSA